MYGEERESSWCYQYSKLDELTYNEIVLPYFCYLRYFIMTFEWKHNVADRFAKKAGFFTVNPSFREL